MTNNIKQQFEGAKQKYTALVRNTNEGALGSFVENFDENFKIALEKAAAGESYNSSLSLNLPYAMDYFLIPKLEPFKKLDVLCKENNLALEVNTHYGKGGTCSTVRVSFGEGETYSSSYCTESGYIPMERRPQPVKKEKNIFQRIWGK